MLHCNLKVSFEYLELVNSVSNELELLLIKNGL